MYFQYRLIKAIIFDCFGVLYPQASGHFFERHKDLFKTNPTVLDELNLKIDLGKINRAQFFKGLTEISGIPEVKIQSEIDQELVLDQALVEFIRKLKSFYKIGLLSNAGKEEIAIIYRDKIDRLFDAIAVSYEVGAVKPGEEIFLSCVRRLDVKPQECLFVDDSLSNIKAAQHLNMQTIIYPDFGNLPQALKLLLSQAQNQ